MAALTQAKNTARKDGVFYNRPVAAGAVIFEGALVCLSAGGYLTPGAVAANLVADGVAISSVDNTGGVNGAVSVEVRKGTFRFGNSTAGDLITIADIGDNCFVVDDQTVAKTNGGATRSVAGRIVEVDADGVWVSIA